MLPTSQNGYTVGRELVKTYTVKDTSIKVPLRSGDTATILLYVMWRYHVRVEPLVPGTCWGYAGRTIRGSGTTWSNHYSGTAVDCNAPQHPLGTDIHKNFTDEQIHLCRAITESLQVSGRPVVRWGGNYTGRKDGMHWEIVGSVADVKTLANRLRNPKKTAPVDGGPTGKFPLKTNHVFSRLETATHHSGMIAKDRPAIKLIQKEVGVKIDGFYGPNTADAVKAWREHYRMASTGDCGKSCWEAMAKH